MATALTFGFWTLPAYADAPTSPAEAPRIAPERREPADPQYHAPVDWNAMYGVAMMSEFTGVKIPTLRYILDVAQCETGRELDHVGNNREGHTYRGMFGFYTQQGGRGGTWDQWGGWQFARYANEANYWQQIVIYLRVHITGFYDYRPDKLKYWPPAGLSVNNCSRYAAPLEWEIW